MSIKEKLKEIFAPSGLSCIYCKKEIPKSYIPVCRNCLEKEIELTQHSFFGSVLYTARYGGIIRELILNCKFREHPSHSKYIAYLMHKTLKANAITADIITYIPMHEKKRQTRGYDQSAMIAEELSKLTGITMLPLLKRVKETKSLFTLSKKERSKEMKGAFKLISKADIKGKTVLLLDDIITTGASMHEASILLEKKKAEVINFAFAKRDN